MRIDKLTPEQKAMLPSFVDFGLKIGLSTERSDRPAAEAAIRAHYAACGIAEPREIRWFDSPFQIVWASVGASVLASVGAYYDADEAAWILAWDTYGLSLPASALTFIELNRHVWWYYPEREVVFVSDRPTAIRKDNDGQLHCETGKAIEFADGWGVSAWHGQTIPHEWVTGSPPSAAQAVRWENMDQRTAACEIIGWHHILDELGARTIDSDPDRSIGTLVEVDLPDHGPQKMLDCICGTGRRFALLAPDEATTALHAQSLLNDVPEWVVKNLKVRT